MPTPPSATPESKRSHGSEPPSTASTTVFIRFACGAAIVPSEKPLLDSPSAITTSATTQQATLAAISWPACCSAGVPFTSQPVLRSWLMSPAFDAATHTTVPTVSTAPIAAVPVQPSARKIAAVLAIVISAIADTGLDDTPIRPTRRDETGTNRKPKSATPSAATTRAPRPRSPAKSHGTVESTITSTTRPTTITQLGRSRSVRSACAFPPPPERPRATAASDCTIVGAVLMTVKRPAQVTAPAPTKIVNWSLIALGVRPAPPAAMWTFVISG